MLAWDYYGYEIFHSFIYYYVSLDKKLLTLFCARKPSQEKTIALCLLVIGTVTHIEHDIWILLKKLQYDTYHGFSDLSIIWRGFLASVGEVEPISWNRIENVFGLEAHDIFYSVITAKQIFVVIRNNHIRRQGIEATKIQGVHTNSRFISAIASLRDTSLSSSSLFTRCCHFCL